ncbi:MAG: nodulation protein NfeD [Elusimicrobia bacterium]|nr:nodulation protein NfeD [Elusimicrobiota bacterium]
MITVKLIIVSFLACLNLLASGRPSHLSKPQAEAYQVKKILVAPYSGIINPAAAEFISQAIDKTNSENFDLMVIQLDTPGGLDSSMREIIKKMLASKAPVAVHIYPQGARAASAGVFISMASPMVAMSPGTNIGAAHPVMIGTIGTGQDDKKNDKTNPMEDKILNDAAAYIKSIAQKNKKNVDWAIKAVTQSDSLSAEEAVSKKAVDFIAKDMDEFLRKIDSREIAGAGMIKISNPAIEHFYPTRRQKFLAVVSDPNIAMILMSIGAAGIFIEMYNPGLILPGIIGAISLVLAFYSFQTLSANFAGIFLILLGFVFFIFEIKVMSYGLLTLGGIISIILGALMLFSQPSLAGVGISMNILSSTIFGLIGVMLILLWIVIRAQRRKVVAGIESLINKTGLAKSSLAPAGTVFVEGELWNAESLEGEIPAGSEIIVESVEGFKVKVVKRQ